MKGIFYRYVDPGHRYITVFGGNSDMSASIERMEDPRFDYNGQIVNLYNISRCNETTLDDVFVS